MPDRLFIDIPDKKQGKTFLIRKARRVGCRGGAGTWNNRGWHL
jgi:hypothetical protein